jgi:hypothetical protein
MKRLMMAATLLSITSAICFGAQSTQSPTAEPAAKPSSSGDSGKLGSTLKGKGVVGKLTKTVGTKNSKTGDIVEVEVTQDAKLGDVFLSKGSVIKGTIAQVSAFAKGKSPADLEVVFDTVLPKTGEQISTHLLIYALARDVPAQPDDIYSSGGTKRLATSAGIAGQVGAPNAGQLTPETVGIFGFDNFELHPLARKDPPTSAVNSPSGNINLDRGTKIVLVFVGQ